tara:strand:- start:2367 stop:2582 length:216 start_codon:yes stop_codon:yes gene_type:complete
LKTSQKQNKLPFFIRLKAQLMFRLREISSYEGTTITQIIEDALDEHLPNRDRGHKFQVKKWLVWKKNDEQK